VREDEWKRIRENGVRRRVGVSVSLGSVPHLFQPLLLYSDLSSALLSTRLSSPFRILCCFLFSITL